MHGIEAVLAHPQALAQCQNWLNKHLPDVERRAVSSNAEGSRLAATNPAWAALSTSGLRDLPAGRYVVEAVDDEAPASHPRKRLASKRRSNRTGKAALLMRSAPARSSMPLSAVERQLYRRGDR